MPSWCGGFMGVLFKGADVNINDTIYNGTIYSDFDGSGFVSFVNQSTMLNIYSSLSNGTIQMLGTKASECGGMIGRVRISNVSLYNCTSRSYIPQNIHTI
jgi:hypothetical protein